MNRLCAAAIALFVAYPCVGEEPVNEEVSQILPFDTPVSKVPLELLAPFHKRVMIRYTEVSNSNVFLFPTFVVSNSEISESGISITLVDFEQYTDFDEVVQESLREHVRFRGRNVKIRDPWLSPDDQWTVTLSTLSPDTGEELSLGRKRLVRVDQLPERTLKFALPPVDRPLNGDLLFLKISGGFRAELTKKSLRATVNACSIAANELWDELLSSPDAQQPDLFAVVGGKAGRNRRFKRLLRQHFNLAISKRSDVTLDATLVAKITDRFLDQALKSIKTEVSAADRVVTLLLSNGITLTSSLGNISEVSRKLKSMNEEKTKSLLKTLYKEAVDLDGKAQAKFMGFGGGASFGYAKSNEDQEESLLEQFRKDLEEIDQQFKGKIPSLYGISLEDIAVIASKGELNGEFSVSDFTTGYRSIHWRLAVERSPEESGTLSSIPVGGIAPYAGTLDVLPDNWRLCDGSLLSREQFPTLFKAIGESHGSDGSLFALPDLRGRFLRGVDHGTGRDLGASQRGKSAQGGNSGDMVGSTQGDATRLPRNPFAAAASGAHQHTVTDGTTHGAHPGPHKGFAATDVPVGQGAPKGAEKHSVNSTHHHGHTHAIRGGDPETRPVNLSVEWIIRVR